VFNSRVSAVLYIYALPRS